MKILWWVRFNPFFNPFFNPIFNPKGLFKLLSNYWGFGDGLDSGLDFGLKLTFENWICKNEGFENERVKFEGFENWVCIQFKGEEEVETLIKMKWQTVKRLGVLLKNWDKIDFGNYEL